MILKAKIINKDILEAKIITGNNNNAAADVYKGEYTVTPGPNEQILKTKDLIMRNDVTVHAIPADLVGKEEQEKSLTITKNGTYEVLPDENKVLSKVDVKVDVPALIPDGVSNELLEKWMNGTEPTGEIVYSHVKVHPNVIANFFAYHTEITSVISEDATSVPSFRNCSKLTNLYFPLVSSSLSQGLNSAGFSGEFRYDKMFPSVKTLGNTTFNGLREITSITLPESVQTIAANAFNIPMPLLTTLYFLGTPTTIASNAIASGLTSITDIYVPWAEGAVANAPWGATKATIHYNYFVEENINAGS